MIGRLADRRFASLDDLNEAIAAEVCANSASPATRSSEERITKAIASPGHPLRQTRSPTEPPQPLRNPHLVTPLGRHTLV